MQRSVFRGKNLAEGDVGGKGDRIPKKSQFTSASLLAKSEFLEGEWLDPSIQKNTPLGGGLLREKSG